MSLQDYEVRESQEAERAQLVPFVFEHGHHHLFTLYLEAHGKRYDAECRRLFVAEDSPIDELPRVPSVVAVHRATGKICGFGLVMVRPNAPSRGPAKFPPGRFTEWMQAVKGPPLSIDLHELFPGVERIARLRQLLVAEEHRRRGLAGALLAEGLELARRKGAQLVSGLFTSPYSQRLASKAGFRSIADFDVADLRNEKGDLMYPGVDSFVYSEMVKELCICRVRSVL